MTRDEVLKALERCRVRLHGALAGLADEALTTTPVIEQWTVKDLLGHMAMWRQVGLKYVEEYRRDGMPKIIGLDGDAAIDAYNERESARRRDWTLPQVRAELDRADRALAEAVARLTDDQLNAPLPTPWQSVQTLERLIAINSYEHDPEHIEQIEKWRSGL